MKRNLCILQVLCCVPTIFSLNISSFFQICDRADDKCLNEAITGSLHYLCENGLPALNIPKLDPVAISQITITSKGNAATMSQQYTDVKLYGFKNASVTKSNLDVHKKQLTFIVHAPVLRQISKYDIKGRILIFALNGKGQAVITQTNVTVLHKLKFKIETKNNNKIWKVKSYSISTIPENTSFKLDGLFPENRLLSDRIHDVVNENWRVLWDEAKPDIDLTYGKVYKEYAESLFDKIPVDEIFPS